MEGEFEANVLQRLEQLEGQVQELMGLRVAVAKSSAEIEVEFESLINQLESYSLQRVLRDVSKERWASAFAGLRRPTMEKLKASVSKNVWGEFIETWALGLYPSQASREEILKAARCLEAMGEITIDPFDHDLGFAAVTAADLNAQLQEWKVRDEAFSLKKREEAQAWMKTELSGLN